MRLLYLTADPGIAVLGHKGASVHVRELVRALQQAGADVVVASPRIDDEGGSVANPVPLVRITAVSPRPDETPRSVRAAVAQQRAEVEDVCREFRIEAVCERYSLFSDAGVSSARRLGLPHVLEVNAPLRDEARRHRVLPHPRLAAAIESGVFALTDRCLCVSEPVARAVRRHRAAAPTEVLPNGVDPARFPEVTRRGDGAFVVGFAGSLKPWHGIETLVEACAIAFPLEPRLQLEVVGGGPMQSVLKSAALPRDRVRVLGPVDHGLALASMRGWDVGVAPYRGERDFYFSPLKVLEYMATGICAVASDLGELRTLLGDGRGLLVRPDDPSALAAALVGLARSPRAARAIGARSRAWVLANRTWAGNAAVVLARLHEAARKAAA